MSHPFAATNHSRTPLVDPAVTLKTLGASNLQITSIGLGAWAIGGSGYRFSWGDQDDQASIKALRHGVEQGINWIDTAAVYGLGHSEEVVGEAVRGLADPPYIFTKCGRVWGEDRNISGSLKSIRTECENSLRRLQVDAIDLYQIHWPDPEQEIEEGWTEMAKLQQEGKVKWIGVSNFNVDQLKKAQAIAPVASLQPPYSLIRRDIEAEILPFCAQNNIGVIVYSPMASGLLTGKMSRERAEALPENDWRSRNPQFQEPALSKNLEIASKLEEVGKLHGKSAGETAIAWTLAHPAVTAAIVGVRSSEQVNGILGAVNFTLSESELAELNAVG
jgi:aryl-alcohol dehydrogenase-like predicted oxidoreductase